MIRCAISAAVLGACGTAQAQIQTVNATIRYTLAWQDDGNHNGVLEPGESALLGLTATMTPPVDTVIEYTNNGNPVTGTLRGLASGFVDIYGDNTLGGVIHDQRIDPVWDLTGVLPQIIGTHQINLQFGQFPQSNAQIITTNPLTDVFTFAWTPASYSPRTALFQVAVATGGEGIISSVYVVTGPNTRVVVNCQSRFGTLPIPIVPAPGSLAAFGLAAVATRRRP